MSALRFGGKTLPEHTDEELEDAETYTLDAILDAAKHYRVMTAFYEAISREMARRLSAG